MVRTHSMLVDPGKILPSFELINVNLMTHEKFNNSSLESKHLLIMFICAHCPFVKHLEKHISRITKDLEEKVQTIAVSSNDISTHPDDSPENLKIQAKKNGWDFPYLYDRDQKFAKQLKAACTPDFYLFRRLNDVTLSLFYHGQLDDSRPSNGLPVTGFDLLSASKELDFNKEYQQKQIPSLGCNIKWTPGNEPEWFK